MSADIDEIKGQTLAVLNEWACRYEPDMFDFFGLPDAANARFTHGLIEKIRADIVEAWAYADNAAAQRDFVGADCCKNYSEVKS